MDIYKKKSRWKLYLAGAGILIIIASMLFTNYLAEKLKIEERKKVELIREAMERLAVQTDLNCDFTLNTNVIEGNTTVPMILTDERDNIQDAKNFPDTSKAYLKKQLQQIKTGDLKPIVVDMQGFSKQVIYYKHSRILTLLTYFPIFQFFLIACFITVGYLLFSSARRSEQNQVWAGMAKETAHQLGTPITAILGWIEQLRLSFEGDENNLEVVEELRNDVTRLELIAERFSKIGAEPELKPTNIYEELEDCRQYMERRSSRKIKFQFPGTSPAPIWVGINKHLFAWVIENLLRNSLDAMQSEGIISCTVHQEQGVVSIDMSDTGKGIPASKHKTIFEPGYTTKMRGWGLGLSLAKRIIELYHKGRIYVKQSDPGKGTTITIKLPVLQQDNPSIQQS